MKATTKKCGDCRYGCYPPLNVKPMYGMGGMMLVCTKPRMRGKGMLMVAPEYKCRGFEAQEATDGTEQ